MISNLRTIRNYKVSINNQILSSGITSEIYYVHEYPSGTKRYFQLCQSHDDCSGRSMKCTSNICKYDPDVCKTGNVKVEIMTDNYPYETSWSVY